MTTKPETEFEFLVKSPAGREFSKVWTGSSMEAAAHRMLDCMESGCSVIAWRYPAAQVTTAPIRGC